MPLISKPNYNQVFASQAPEQDKPAVFNNYPLGWGVESRPNNGKPTIKGFNYLQQTSDLKDLWILQNGACLPYDDSIEYAEGAPVLKDGVIQYKTAGGFKSRDAVTIPTYNSAADGIDPVTGVAEGAYFNVRSSSDDSYVDEYQNVGGVPAPSGKSYPSAAYVQNVAKHTALPFVAGKTYSLNERVSLNDGAVVKNALNSNSNNPNINISGWVRTDSNVVNVKSISDLKAMPASALDTAVVYRVESYIAGLYQGGGDFKWTPGSFTSQIADDPKNGIYVPCSSSGSGAFVRIVTPNDFYSIYWFGAYCDGSTNDTVAYLELLKHAAKLTNVRIDLGSKDFVVNLTSIAIPILDAKASVTVKSSGAAILDRTTYTAGVPERDILKITNCGQVTGIGKYKVVGQTPTNQAVGLRGGRAIVLEFCSNVDLDIISRLNASPLISQVTDKATPNLNWRVTIDSEDDYYGAIAFNVTGIDIRIESKKAYRSFIFGGLKGEAFVSSAGQVGTSLFKHYDTSQQIEDFRSVFIVRDANPYTPTASAVGIEMQSSEANSAKWKNVDVVLDIENNTSNPYSLNLFHISNIELEGGIVNRNHTVDNMVITGVLDGKGLSSNCIEYSRSRTFANAGFRPIFRNIKSDSDLLVKEGERYVMENCEIAGKSISYSIDRPVSISARTSGSLETPINILASRNGAVRSLVSIDYMIFDNWLSTNNNYTIGRYDGYLIVTATGTTTIQLRKVFEEVVGKPATVTFGNAAGNGANTAYLTVSAPEYVLANTRGTFNVTVTYQDPAFQGRLVPV